MRSPTPYSLEKFKTSATIASLLLAKANKKGKEAHKASSTHHLSFQKGTFLSSPKDQIKIKEYRLTFHSNLLLKTNPVTSSNFVNAPAPCVKPNFLQISSLQGESLSLANHNNHLHKTMRALF